MSNTQVSTDHSNQLFVPPAYDQPHVFRQVEEIISGVTEVVSKVWPLKDYVAINPYAGIAGRTFSDARAFLKVFSDCELLMPIQYYRSQYHQGQFTRGDIREAIAQCSHPGASSVPSVERVLQQLRRTPNADTAHTAPVANRPIRSIAEYARDVSDTDWTELVSDEICKLCSAHYDQGQAVWKNPWKELPLFQAWRSAAVHDRNPEVMGLHGFREFVDSIPHTPQAAIVHLLTCLQIPVALWESFLLCQVFTLPGWFAWAKYQDSLDDQVEGQALTGMLAIRLAFDVGVSRATGLDVKWDAMIDENSASFRPPSLDDSDDSAIRTVLLHASEIAYRKRILNRLTVSAPAISRRKLAQMVFCIDVRSERMRRNLEGQSPEIETMGFAGFFGMPIEYVKLGQCQGSSNVPALIKPHFKLHEGTVGDNSNSDADIAKMRQRTASWKGAWNRFQKSAVGCFSFVETVGLSYAVELLSKTVGWPKSNPSLTEQPVAVEGTPTGPTLRGLHHQGLTTSAQVDLAESMLRNLGLVDDFARLVVFVGHSSQTANNPLAAGLDCGACGGHSGEPNARFAALLMNQPCVREALCERGINIPDDTYFVAALHNTTTDELVYFDLDQVPVALRGDIEEVLDGSQSASARTRKERTPIVGASNQSDLLRRAVDWSEVRPEWGLAGNAGFFVGPRWMTKDLNLDGRMFLHSYDNSTDSDGIVLENIMTAPMVVAHWINMQYYASTVDNRHFGSGDKTVHNVVGGFGILSGGSGDLMTGLPVQSLGDGKSLQHVPVRLQVFIAAPKATIAKIVEKHPMIKDLVDNEWLHLIAIEQGNAQRYSDASWVAVGDDGHHSETVSQF